jgi:hypothetical protein
MSTLTVQNIQGSSSSGNTISVASGHVLQAPGHVLQVTAGGTTSRITTTSTSYADIGVSANITPSSTSSKVLIIVTGVMGNNNEFSSMLQEANSGYHYSGFGQTFLDSPSTTSETTYKIFMKAANATAALGGRADNNDIGVPTRIVLMEIAG